MTSQNAKHPPNSGQTDFLQGVGRGAVLSSSSHVTEPHVYTYLAGHLERDATDGSFVDGVTDALIVFALEGTDPDQGILMSEEEIRTKIIDALPAAKSLLDDRLRDRLEMISRKDGRRIRWHRKEDQWALPYEDRKELVRASIEDESLRISVRQELSTQFSEIQMPLDLNASDLADFALDTIQLAFEEDGLRFSGFLEEGNLEDSTAFVSDALRKVLTDAGLTGDTRMDAARAIIAILRNVFYASTEKQRILLQRISRAYGILFALTREPRVLRYFDDAMSDTYLYVGGDVIVTALSERYVQPEDQRTRNLLKSARLTGAHLILAAPVLDEVLGHLRASDNEYLNYVAPFEDMTYEFARQVPKILVRAYLYSQLLESHGSPGSWSEFISQFCRYSDLHTENALVQLQRYLEHQFVFEFEDWQTIHDKCAYERHEFLASALRTVKTSEFLASNDAYIYQLVTHRRSWEGTADHSSEFGYQTWWLSGGEGAAVRAMAQADNGTRRILMRPGFLAKYILLAPSAAEARQSLADFLPSLLGIKIARRVEEDDFRKMVVTLREAEALEPGGRASRIADYTDRLRTATSFELGEQWPQEAAREFLHVDLEDLS